MNGEAAQPSRILSSALTLALFAAVCTALVSLTFAVTRDRIVANQQFFIEQSLRPVLEGIAYEGRLSDSTIVIRPPHDLPGTGPATVYRVYANQQPIAALFVVTAMNGYSGPIRLLIGVTADGAVTRVRVVDHRETPGLGDGIEASKSDWIEQFNRRSLTSPPPERWEIGRDGGDFDQLTGASVTSRAVVHAVRRTLAYFATHRDTIFSAERQ